MGRLFAHIKEHDKRYIFLFLLLTTSVFLLFMYHVKSSDYYKRQENGIVVVGQVVNSEYKEREITEYDSDAIPYTTKESYYLIEVKYEYQEKIHLWTYESDYNVSIGQTKELFIDSEEPTYVFNDGNPGSIFLVFGLIFFTIFALIIMFLVFKMNAFFILFGLGAVGFLLATVVCSLNSSFLAIVFFAASSAFAAVSFLFYKLCKSK